MTPEQEMFRDVFVHVLAAAVGADRTTNQLGNNSGGGNAKMQERLSCAYDHAQWAVSMIFGQQQHQAAPQSRPVQQPQPRQFPMNAPGARPPAPMQMQPPGPPMGVPFRNGDGDTTVVLRPIDPARLQGGAPAPQQFTPMAPPDNPFTQQIPVQDDQNGGAQ